MLCGVVGVSELLSIDDVNPEHIKIVQQSSKRMLKEIELQQCLIQNERFSYQSELVEITPGEIINELESYFINHPAAMGKFVTFSHSELNVPLRIDVSMLLRVLCNMVTNAFEATDDNGRIKVWFEQKQGFISFCVWNNKSIDESTSLRIFQRNFSTKNGEGRGIGTYSMKLFGEKMLGGKVSFTTSPENGTTFKIALSC
jgi:signal transduction histidine kinase